MPLLPGSDRATIAENIHEMVKAGHPVDQAVAASLNNADKTKAQRTPHVTAQRWRRGYFSSHHVRTPAPTGDDAVGNDAPPKGAPQASPAAAADPEKPAPQPSVLDADLNADNYDNVEMRKQHVRREVWAQRFDDSKHPRGPGGKFGPGGGGAATKPAQPKPAAPKPAPPPPPGTKPNGIAHVGPESHKTKGPEAQDYAPGTSAPKMPTEDLKVHEHDENFGGGKAHGEGTHHSEPEHVGSSSHPEKDEEVHAALSHARELDEKARKARDEDDKLFKAAAASGSDTDRKKWGDAVVAHKQAREAAAAHAEKTKKLLDAHPDQEWAKKTVVEEKKKMQKEANEKHLNPPDEWPSFFHHLGRSAGAVEPFGQDAGEPSQP